MRKSYRRFVRFLTVSAALFLSAHVLLSRTTRNNLPEPSPLPVEEYRLLSPDTYRYQLNQPAVCQTRTRTRTRTGTPFLVLMVAVAPQEAAARRAVRSTWGSAGQDTLTLFFVGAPGGPQRSDLQTSLEEESRTHGDIIQMDFLDSYSNLTIKTMMMMSWLASHCPHASYAMKVDADVFVNVEHLLRRLRSSPRQAFITGSVISDGRPRRDRTSKWFVSEELYPEDRFPPYVSGAGYVFSADLASRISRASRFVRMIPLEDVYVGLCLRLLNVRPVYAISLPALRNLFEIRQLDYDRCTFSRLVLASGFRPSQLLHMWQDFSSGSC